MNKKEYIKPSVLKIKHVYPTHIICGSGGESGKLSTSSNQEDVPTTTTNTVGGTLYTGIWSE